MHTVAQLITAMPEFRLNIRRSRCLTKAAVIASGRDATRTLVVTTAVQAGEDYHLVHMLSCGPRDLMVAWPHEHVVLELRPEKWCSLERIIRAFLAGAGEDQLCELAWNYV